MTIEPTIDQGQKLTPPAGKVIGFISGKAEFEAFTKAVLAAGYSPPQITSLFGDDGIQLLERLKKDNFFFGDSEDGVIKLGIRELQQGHYAAAVEVADHHQAVQIESLAEPHGGHSFSYFGTWVSEQLSK
jgi:hypothetical protein